MIITHKKFNDLINSINKIERFGVEKKKKSKILENFVSNFNIL